MKINLQKIEQFYDSNLGQYAFSRIAHILKKTDFNKSISICSAGGFRYKKYFENAPRFAMQAYHDQSVWPEGGQGNYLLSDRIHWPYRAEEVDICIMIHDIEFAENPEGYLREAWRALKGEGELILVIPNRSGAWARQSNNPFGKGYPYTFEQIEKLLGRAHFTIDDTIGCLYSAANIPKNIFARTLRGVMEKFGANMMLHPGVFIIRASKHVYAPTKGLKVNVGEIAKQALFPKPKPTNLSSEKK